MIPTLTLSEFGAALTPDSNTTALMYNNKSPILWTNDNILLKIGKA